MLVVDATINDADLDALPGFVEANLVPHAVDLMDHHGAVEHGAEDAHGYHTLYAGDIAERRGIVGFDKQGVTHQIDAAGDACTKRLHTAADICLALADSGTLGATPSGRCAVKFHDEAARNNLSPKAGGDQQD
ncbi:hypothetical protein F183_A32460 [Bryobacterales bacterium F-183]|nr:hypothetical protein F183_A32460 [Bryobacterales bacterium F-183]